MSSAPRRTVSATSEPAWPPSASPDFKLLSPLLDRVGHHPVNPYGGQQHSQSAEESEQGGDQPGRPDRVTHQCVHGLEIGDRQIAIELAQERAHRTGVRRRVARPADDQRHRRVRKLRQRPIDLLKWRVGRPLVTDIPDHAYDLHPFVPIPFVEKMVAEGAPGGPERRASDSPITATAGVSLPSVSTRLRPSSRGIPIAAK